MVAENYSFVYSSFKVHSRVSGVFIYSAIYCLNVWVCVCVCVCLWGRCPLVQCLRLTSLIEMQFVCVSPQGFIIQTKI